MGLVCDINDFKSADCHCRGWNAKDWTSSDDRVRGGKSQVICRHFGKQTRNGALIGFIVLP